ncbi:hypothetical protein LSTR_LSTR004646 [Laodelphax striatellus]|uniref:Protein osiris 1 n=1 Tax=Laodelphax striatellus TaxID=195883 RepID=A0A482WU05_LAOST|nr:hypothetical protein LSTR_LSTR004646 [Laodelphax striatellus]
MPACRYSATAVAIGFAIILGLFSSRVSADFSEDAFLMKARDACRASASAMACPSYWALSSVSTLLRSRHAPIQAGPAWLVQLQTPDNVTTSLLPKQLLSSSRQLDNEMSFSAIGQFLLRQLDGWMRGHGIAFHTPGAQVIMLDDSAGRLYEGDEDVDNSSEESKKFTEKRGHHKKKKFALLFPILAFMKYLAIKAILVPIFMSVVFLKKIAILALIYLPTLLASLKICKKEPIYFSKPLFPQEHHETTDYDNSGGYQFSGYDNTKDWSHYGARRNIYH